MSKRKKLHEWLLSDGGWLYLAEVPRAQFGMSLQTCSTALLDLSRQGRVEFRIVGKHQYRAVKPDGIKRNPKLQKELK